MGQTPEFRSVPSSPESPRLRSATPSPASASACACHRRCSSASVSASHRRSSSTSVSVSVSHRRSPSVPVSHRRSPSLSVSTTHGGSSTPGWQLANDPQTPAHPKSRFAEAAGGTAASCAAICCCCPCGVFNLFVAVVKLPAALARRALRQRRMRILRRLAGAGRKKKAGFSNDDDDEFSIHRGYLLPKEEETWPAKPKAAAELAELLALEREMLAKFYSAGFWRSPSQREEQQQQQ